VFDLGSDDPVYANVAFRLAKAVANGEYDRGILYAERASAFRWRPTR
jgi:ribose 5-phosphate isomerase RpiB